MVLEIPAVASLWFPLILVEPQRHPPTTLLLLSWSSTYSTGTTYCIFPPFELDYYAIRIPTLNKNTQTNSCNTSMAHNKTIHGNYFK